MLMKADNPEGVHVQAIVYSGQDSDTTVPVSESLNWEHGVFRRHRQSETTAATIGAEAYAPMTMANKDFLVLHLGRYSENHLI